MSDNDKDRPVNLGNLDIKQECERMAQKYLPKVEDALDFLLENDHYKGIMAWERIAEFAIAKKSKENLIPANTTITINMVPAKTEDTGYIDITDQKKLGEESEFDEE